MPFVEQETKMSNEWVIIQCGDYLQIQNSKSCVVRMIQQELEEILFELGGECERLGDGERSVSQDLVI